MSITFKTLPFTWTNESKAQFSNPFVTNENFPSLYHFKVLFGLNHSHIVNRSQRFKLYWDCGWWGLSYFGGGAHADELRFKICFDNYRRISPLTCLKLWLLSLVPHLRMRWFTKVLHVIRAHEDHSCTVTFSVIYAPNNSFAGLFFFQKCLLSFHTIPFPVWKVSVHHIHICKPITFCHCKSKQADLNLLIITNLFC